VISANGHYPDEESEVVDRFSVTDDSISWRLHWGATEIRWSGDIRGDFIVGELKALAKGKQHFSGVWTAVRQSAARERDGRTRP
jgi:hypothetical protein